MTSKIYLVEGMTCNHCKARVEKSIQTIAGVENVTADPASGQVKVSGDEIDQKRVKEMVEEAGYFFKGEV